MSDHPDDADDGDLPGTSTGPTTGKDQGSYRTTYEAEQEVPLAGVASPGPPDPVEAAADPAAVPLEAASEHYGAGEPAPPEAPDSPPFSSSLYPASSESTGLTHRGDEVVGLEDGPQEGLADPTP